MEEDGSGWTSPKRGLATKNGEQKNRSTGTEFRRSKKAQTVQGGDGVHERIEQAEDEDADQGGRSNQPNHVHRADDGHERRPHDHRSHLANVEDPLAVVGHQVDQLSQSNETLPLETHYVVHGCAAWLEWKTKTESSYWDFDFQIIDSSTEVNCVFKFPFGWKWRRWNNIFLSVAKVSTEVVQAVLLAAPLDRWYGGLKMKKKVTNVQKWRLTSPIDLSPGEDSRRIFL